MEETGAKITAFSKMPPLICGDKVISLDEPVVMGILNLTPDSFYDGGFYSDEMQILGKTGRMQEEGAAIIDVGAVSTRPGAADISAGEELRRLLPAVKAIVRHFPELVFSVDTYRAQVAKIMAEEGISIVNDISAGNLDPEMLPMMASLNLPYVLMHMQGTPRTMQVEPKYADPVEEIRLFFEKKVAQLELAGIKQVLLDPGFGFGKTLGHNYMLLKKLSEFNFPGKPLLIGVSRKSMITRLLKIPPEEALNGTTALHTLALMNGAKILRVHDVKEARQTIEIARQYFAS